MSDSDKKAAKKASKRKLPPGEEAGRVPATPLEIDTEFLCEYCGEKNIVTLDPTAGWRQDFTVDCDACCSPNHLKARISEDGDVELDVERGHD